MGILQTKYEYRWFINSIPRYNKSHQLDLRLFTDDTWYSTKEEAKKAGCVWHENNGGDLDMPASHFACLGIERKRC